MSRRIVWSTRAVKDAERLDGRMRQRVLIALDHFAATGTGDVKAIKGRAGVSRLRVGDYRVLFASIEDALIVERVAHRRDAYR